MNFSNEALSIIDLGIMAYMEHLNHDIAGVRKQASLSDDMKKNGGYDDTYAEDARYCNEVARRISLAIICCVMVLFISFVLIALVRMERKFEKRSNDDYIVYRSKGGYIVEELQ